jgi:DNA-binding NtrC family response regulator
MAAHVLIIEDDNDLRAEMLDYLVRRDYPVTACATLSEAGEALQVRKGAFGPPAVVIVDIRLPDGDGISFYMENASRFPDAKWILMSGNHDLVRLASRLKDAVDLSTCTVVDKPMPMRLMTRFIDGQLATQRVA